MADRPPLESFVKRPPLESFVIGAQDNAAPNEISGTADVKGPMSLGEVATGAVKNLVPSAIQFGKDIVQPFVHPIDTAENLYKAGSGVAQKAGLQSGDENVKYADAIGQFFKERYGGLENIKKTLATDPVGFAADLSTALSGGGALLRGAGKIGELDRAATFSTKAATKITDTNFGKAHPSFEQFLDEGKPTLLTNPGEMVGLPEDVQKRLLSNPNKRAVTGPNGQHYFIFWQPGAENAANRLAQIYSAGIHATPERAAEIGQLLAYPPKEINEFVKSAFPGSKVTVPETSKLAHAGQALSTAGRVVNPLSIIPAAGKVGAEVIGGLGTHTGAEALRTAAQAGQKGGAAAAAFLANMRGTEPMEQTVAAARQALGKIRQDRGEAYRAGMAGVGTDKTVLDFDKIDNALAEVAGVKTYKGQNLSPKTQGIRLEIGNAIADWKKLDPAEFHTAEGIDALKQKLGDIRDAAQPGTPERVVADRAYHAVRATIVDQVPEYAKVMKGYEEASKQIKEIERTLSLNPNASIDTALRKLQSVLRDNVNTSFGRRKELADFLVKAGAPHLMERLAGQAMKSWTPRGLAKLLGGEILAAGAGALGAGGTAAGAGAGAMAALPFMSPRLMGEGAYYAGKASRLPLRSTGQGAFQAGRIGNHLDPREMVRQDAKAALRDKSASYSPSELAAMRAVARGSAPIDTVLTVKRLLEKPAYGGTL